MPKKKPPSPAPEKPSEPGKPFDPLVLDKTVIAIPLLEKIRQENEGKAERVIYNVIIDLNLEYPSGRDGARDWVIANVDKAKQAVRQKSELVPGAQGVDQAKSKQTNQYLFAALEGRLIQELVRLDEQEASLPRQTVDSAPEHKGPSRPSTSNRAIYRIWPDFEVTALINKSIATVKADAARNSFGAVGDGIVWAVMDSGINKDHPHFKKYGNIELGRFHRDFTVPNDAGNPFNDENGHGTHVAGIIAGEQVATDGQTFRAIYRFRSETGEIKPDTLDQRHGSVV
jgi:serine protease AprX